MIFIPGRVPMFIPTTGSFSGPWTSFHTALVVVGTCVTIAVFIFLFGFVCGAAEANDDFDWKEHFDNLAKILFSPLLVPGYILGYVLFRSWRKRRTY